MMESSSSPPSSSCHQIRQLGQTCDRCRKKKIRCDGVVPVCHHCAKAGTPCESSAILQRNTKVRGFVTDEKYTQNLQRQLFKCQEALKTEHRTVAALRQQLARQHPPPGPSTITLAPVNPVGTPKTMIPSSGSAPATVSDGSVYVIKHMGRMIHDEAGVGRFAGSTSGVHFLLNVEESCTRALNITQRFPEGCYSLYLGQSTSTPESDSISLYEHIIECLGQPINFYLEHVQVFFCNWEAFCPVLATKQVVDDIICLVENVQSRSTMDTIDEAVLCILLSILGVNFLTNSMGDYHNLDTESSARQYISLAARTQSRLIARADIGSLQALVIFAFYHQLSGRALSLIQLNGHIVCIAQSLGLHRRSRCFELTVSETELRKRLWWWAYTFDRITSIVHGLPPLIRDPNVDNDMPTDCLLINLDDTELSHLPPDQRSPVFAFNHYTTMGQKISSILDIMYMSTHRQGAREILQLSRELKEWTRVFCADDAACQTNAKDGGCRLMFQWLRLLTNLSLVLIHRPGLTFDENSPDFATCLNLCARSSTEIINMLGVSDKATYFRSLCPVGPGLVFHCALMHVYCQCKVKIIQSLVGIPHLHESIGAIASAVQILERYSELDCSGSPENSLFSQSLQSAIKTLKDLKFYLQDVA